MIKLYDLRINALFDSLSLYIYTMFTTSSILSSLQEQDRKRSVGRHEVYLRTHKKQKGKGAFVDNKSAVVEVSLFLVFRFISIFCGC